MPPWRGSVKRSQNGQIVMPFCQDCGGEFTDSLRSPRCPSCRKEAIRRQKREGMRHRRNTPTLYPKPCARCGNVFMPKTSKNTYCTDCTAINRLEKMREAQKRYHQENHDHYLELYRKNYARTRAKVRLAAGDKTAFFLAHEKQIIECPRMHVRMMAGLCGQREECFGFNPCPNCPPGAQRPRIALS